jgi:tetratricopeptide (TPR) repeat protein
VPALMLAAALALLLGACATPQADAVRALPPPGLRPAHEIPGVPFYAQDRDQCGPATLAMALAATGLARTPDSLRERVFVPGRAGSFSTEMLAAARREGRLAVALEPSLAAVLREVDGGHPVIVLQNLGLSFIPVWHYALVIGYDLPAGQLLLHTGPQARARMSLELFERTWARGGHWAMVVTDPPALPVSPPPDALVDAAAALERVDAAAAQRAYEAVLRRAPSHYGAWMGLGNSAYAQGDSGAAVRAFEAASRIAPDHGDAWNNLASALAARGDTGPAQAAIDRALSLGGPHRAVYEQTAAEIAQARARSTEPQRH